MPISYQHKPDINLAILDHVGNIPDDELLSSYRAFYENTDCDMSCNLLVDLRKSDSSQRSTAALLELAGYIQKQHENIAEPTRVAVIALDRRSFELACIYEVFSNDVHEDFEVFCDIPTALEWLKVPENLADSIEKDA